jgi:hypothetical protein
MNKDIERLIEIELEEANKKFSPFSSRHEAYGVLLEEYEEMKAEIEEIKAELNHYWTACKMLKNDEIKEYIMSGYWSTYGDEHTARILTCLERAVQKTISEAIQIGAMVLKAKRLEKSKLEE